MSQISVNKQTIATNPCVTTLRYNIPSLRFQMFPSDVVHDFPGHFFSSRGGASNSSAARGKSTSECSMTTIVIVTQLGVTRLGVTHCYMNVGEAGQAVSIDGTGVQDLETRAQTRGGRDPSSQELRC